jgi:Ni/Fe-hydrogenase 1 B-type cytochrome subunit
MAAVVPPSRAEAHATARPARHTVYVWELPVRIIHWTIVVTLVVLSVTGYYIYDPFFSGSGQPGHPGFTMGEMRFIHEGAGFVFIAAILSRIYWAFVGNRYAHWRALLPITPGQRRDLRHTLRFYLFLRRDPPHTNGHNPLAGLSYVGLYIGFIITSLTGLGLFAWVIRRPPWTTLFGWTWSVMSVPALRLLHFLLMFVFWAFAVHHVYAAGLYDVEERNGELSSIITGYKVDVMPRETPPDDPRREET